MRAGKLFVLLAGVVVFAGGCLGPRPKPAPDPDWPKKVVWYQIFPERFRNGDPSNDPKPEDAGIQNYPGWKISPWTADWFALTPWERARSDRFYDVVFDRRYGGDLQGVIDELDYLRDLGIRALYFNPIFESPSLHKYDASMYRHVDNNFGPDPEGDRKIWESENPADSSTWKWTSADRLFLRLIQEAHKRDMKVIIDGVFNHVGNTFWAFQDVVKNGPKSKYADWFVIKRWDDPKTPENEFDYACWWGVRTLPEFREDEHGLVEGPRRHIFAITRRWMDPNGDGDPSDGVDGWRLDVPEEVNPAFWVDWCALVRKINPYAYTTGEIWGDAQPWLQGDRFTAVMNYRWAQAVVAYFVNRERKITASEFARRLEDLRRRYPPGVSYLLQNLIDSHDTDRLASMIVNPDRDFDRDNSPRWNPSYKVRKPHPDEWRLMRLVVLFQMTYVGAPMVYYGDEAGMWGPDDPDDRKPMVWPNMTFADEATHPLPGHTRPRDPVTFDRDLYAWYRKLIHLRNEQPVFQLGGYRTVLTDDEKDVFAFSRSLGSAQALVVLNRSEQPQTVDLPAQRRRYRNVLDGEKVKARNGVVRVKLEPVSGAILLAKM